MFAAKSDAFANQTPRCLTQESGNHSLPGMAACADGMKSHITTAWQSGPASQSHLMWQFWRPQLCPGCLRFIDFNEQLETIMAMGALGGAGRPSASDDRCLGLGPLLSEWKWKTNGSVMAPRLSLHTCARMLPRCRAHVLRTHTFTHTSLTGESEHIQESQLRLKVLFTLRSLSQQQAQDYRTANIKMKATTTPIKMLAIFFSLLQRHFSSRTLTPTLTCDMSHVIWLWNSVLLSEITPIINTLQVSPGSDVAQTFPWEHVDVVRTCLIYIHQREQESLTSYCLRSTA